MLSFRDMIAQRRGGAPIQNQYEQVEKPASQASSGILPSSGSQSSAPTQDFGPLQQGLFASLLERLYPPQIPMSTVFPRFGFGFGLGVVPGAVSSIMPTNRPQNIPLPQVSFQNNPVATMFLRNIFAPGLLGMFPGAFGVGQQAAAPTMSFQDILARYGNALQRRPMPEIFID